MKAEISLFPWTLEIDGDMKTGIVVAENNIRAGTKVLAEFSSSHDIRKLRKLIKVGPPLEFSDIQVAEINFDNCVIADTAPLFFGSKLPVPVTIDELPSYLDGAYDGDTFTIIKDPRIDVRRSEKDKPKTPSDFLALLKKFKLTPIGPDKYQ